MKIVITAGGTKEAIDKVRHITNMSTGSLGREISRIFEQEKEIDKIYFLAPTLPTNISDKVITIKTESVDDLYNNLKSILENHKIDAVIHSMAVSDFTVDSVFTFEKLAEYLANELAKMEDTASYPDILAKLKNVEAYSIDNSSKISSKSQNMGITLKPTQKIIGEIKKWSPNTILVGFKLLEGVTDAELLKVAREQIYKNNCDYVWTNDIKRIRESGHQGMLVGEKGWKEEKGKTEIAKLIVKQVVKHHGDLNV